jgi:hypothetical protein
LTVVSSAAVSMVCKWLCCVLTHIHSAICPGVV